MQRIRFLFCLAWLFALSEALSAAGWEETKIGVQPYVSFESFCAFYHFEPVPVPEEGSFEVSGPYGKLTFFPNSRDMRWNGRRVWLSFAFVRREDGRGFVSKLDVIKLFDPLLRRSEMAPRKPVLGVVIDAGHGGTDNGARSRAGILEKNVALDTAKRLKALLDAAEIPNMMTRTRDEFILLEERASLANKKPDWIFISLHYNSGPSHAHGVETYTLTPQYSSSTGDSGRPTVKDRIAENGNAQDTLNLVLADYMHQHLSKMHSPEGDRGLKRARFVVLRKIKIPGILVEGGFLSNPVDSKLISTGSYRQKVAQATFNAIRDYQKLMDSPLSQAPLSLRAVGKEPPAVPEKKAEPATPPVPAPAAPTPPAPAPAETPTTPSESPKPSGAAPVYQADPKVLLSKPVVIPRTAESSEEDKTHEKSGEGSSDSKPNKPDQATGTAP
ncbi:MAG: N-acetylmuramoyl-L-alanine amidase [Blastochloris sp.]|nr:N-acetylmuramoyl-L-alanine amidase [Blastochloris sp.]